MPIAATVGSVLPAMPGMAAGAVVPWIMSFFGTIVPGVGTIQAGGIIGAILGRTFSLNI